MSQVHSTANTAHDDELSLLDLFIVLLKQKKMILGVTLAGALLSVGISLVMPNIYNARASLLPPQQAQSGASAMLAQLGGLAGSVGGAIGVKNPSDLYIGMLKSRVVADRLIERFKLKEVYAVDSGDLARAALAADTDISSGKDGLIAIVVEGEDKQLVAKLANAYTAELIDLTKVLAVTEAAQRRLFYENQLSQTKDNLAKAENALKGGLDANGVISVEAESKAVLETAARVRAQISAKEIELNAKRPFVTPSHPEFKLVEEELNSLRQELFKLQNGRAARGDAAASDSDAGLGNIQRLRDLKYHQALYEFLSRQYEIARLDEAKNPGIIQVLDAAIEPERKIKPRRSMIVIGGTLAAFVLACAWVLLGHAARSAAASADGRSRFAEVRRLLRIRS